ncbi:MAG: carboxypeptidase regulatory-like domain-containing protein [Planctomycetes bacterium]|nr:carboxypeptidase regulatory-like domain-containing protein [Planctomycetota bacterium]
MPHRRQLFLVALLLALATASVYVFRAAAPRSATKPTEVAGDAAAARAVAIEPAATATEAPQRVGVAAPPSVDDGVLVRVVQAETQAPVANARVLWLDGGAAEGRAPWLWFDRALRERVADEIGRTFRTDEHGEVRVPRPEASVQPLAWVLASDGAASGESNLRDQDVLVIELARDTELRAQVFDADGSPRGGVVVRLHASRASGGSGAGPITVSGVTRAEDGLAVLPHASTLVGSGADHECVLHVEALLDPPLERWVTSAELGGEPLRFDLPPTGSVSVALRDARGELEPLAREVELALESDYTRPLRASTSSGVAEFPLVGLGFELRARVATEFGEAIPETDGAGPTKPDEHVRLELAPPDDAPILVARLFDDAGRALADRRIRVTPRFESDGRSWGYLLVVKSDSAATIAVALPESWTGEGMRRITFALELPVGPDAPDADVELDGELAPGRHDLGDVTLSRPPLIASGRVIDDAGEPVVGANVVAWRISDDPSSDPFIGSPETDDTRTRADGRFELRGRLTRDFTGVYVRDGRYLPLAPVRVDVGTEGLELALDRAANFTGALLVDPGVNDHELAVVARRADGSEVSAEVVTSFEPSGGLQYYFSDLRPGTYDFEYRLRGPGALLTIAGARVAAREPDPRLLAVDLRGRIDEFTCRVFGDGDAPIARGTIVSRATGSSDDWREAPIVDGLARVLTNAESVDLVVGAPGRRTQELTTTTRETTVRLAPGLDVRLALASSASLPAGDFRLEAVLRRDAESARIERVEGRPIAVFGSDGVARATLGSPGTYVVWWRVATAVADDRGARTTLSTPKLELRVLDTSDEQRFELALDPEIVAAAIAKLGPRAR